MRFRYAFLLELLIISTLVNASLKASPVNVLGKFDASSPSGNSIPDIGTLPLKGEKNEDLGAPRVNFAAPIYPTHPTITVTTEPIPFSVPSIQTVTSTTTRSHTVKVIRTSDIWVTRQSEVVIPVTQFTTERINIPQQEDTVTSVIRITLTPVEVFTNTIASLASKRVESVYTAFHTITDTVVYWQYVTHVKTSFEINTRPVEETQTLHQLILSTITTIATTTVTETYTRSVIPAFSYSYTYPYYHTY